MSQLALISGLLSVHQVIYTWLISFSTASDLTSAVKPDGFPHLIHFFGRYFNLKLPE